MTNASRAEVAERANAASSAEPNSAPITPSPRTVRPKKISEAATRMRARQSTSPIASPWPAMNPLPMTSTPRPASRMPSANGTYPGPIRSGEPTS